MKSVFAAVAFTVLAATSTIAQAGNNETIGTILGGAAGAVAGSQFGQGQGNLAATAAGTLLGAFVGGEMGNSMDKTDRMHAQRATLSALNGNGGGHVAWNNPRSGRSGRVVPIKSYERRGARCRDFEQIVEYRGRPYHSFGTACRTPNGNWKIVDLR
ncbi:MAG: glycine zipper 2TM domain-containing protein [Alphaproteobacteria bacterium]|nr:glycine zipper 2TM domain-containing protein [Alphaproteobacteria bacterium]